MTIGIARGASGPEPFLIKKKHKSNTADGRNHLIMEMSITPSVFVIETYMLDYIPRF